MNLRSIQQLKANLPCIATLCLSFVFSGISLAEQPQANPTQQMNQVNTAFLHVVFDPDKPAINELSVDSLGHGEFRPNRLLKNEETHALYLVSLKDGWLSYALKSDPAHPVWQVRGEGDSLHFKSEYSPLSTKQDLVLNFNPDTSHATLLGRINTAGDVSLPAVLHLPGMGSLRVHEKTSTDIALGYDARRAGTPYVRVTFPAATAAHRTVEYSLQAAAIYPTVPGMSSEDRKYDGFRRDFLDIFQLQARLHMLANNTASDACAFTLYLYSDVARYTPKLAEGLTALDLVRDTLDGYLHGFKGYGMPDSKMFDSDDHSSQPYMFLDVYPSLLISAFDYVDGADDPRWLQANYPKLRAWADAMIAPNPDGSPLLEYPASGNSGSWPLEIVVRPSNWWDTIGFGHQDAYSNALAYRALRSMASLSERNHQSADAARYRSSAAALRAAFAKAFIDPASGVIGGWKSKDGELHNYYFTFVNGIAVRYGLLDPDQSRAAMDALQRKMVAVGYHRFDLGLPGNLIPVRRADYVDLDPRFGGPAREDGTDGFQKYENGGATACFSYFTIAALYELGERKQADAILMPMLQSFAKGGFAGRSNNGMTYDWMDWQGEAHGYEGFLVDNYYTFLAVLDRAKMLRPLP